VAALGLVGCTATAPGGPGPGSDAAGGMPLAPGAILFDPPGATFTGVGRVTLTAPGGGDIHVTTDGSLPAAGSPVYAGPLALEESAVVRALVVKDGMPAGAVYAGVFIRVADELAGWSSDLPVVVLHTHSAGALPAIVDAPFVGGTVTALAPGGGGRTALVGRPALAARAGMHVHGQSSVKFPQKSYNLELRGDGDDGDQGRPLLDLPAESDFVLVGAAFLDRSLMRNALAYAVSRSIGRYAPRTRFVELFLVADRAPVGMRHYLGVYTLAEKVKRDPARVDVARLDPGALDMPAVSGGYIISIDKGTAHFTAAGTRFQYVYPDWTELNVPARAPQRAYLEGQVREFLEAVARPDFLHPTTRRHYRDYIDVPAFIDHNLMACLWKNVDALRFSTYFHKPLGAPLAAGPVWDFDRSAGTSFDEQFMPPRAREPREWASGDATNPLTQGFWGRLFADPAFKSAHGARWRELAGGAFSVGAIHAQIDAMAAQLREAQARHFARWPEMAATGGSHAEEVRILKEWFAARVPWVSTQLSP
jgi:hypothetical protein